MGRVCYGPRCPESYLIPGYSIVLSLKSAILVFFVVISKILLFRIF